MIHIAFDVQQNKMHVVRRSSCILLKTAVPIVKTNVFVLCERYVFRIFAMDILIRQVQTKLMKLTANSGRAATSIQDVIKLGIVPMVLMRLIVIQLPDVILIVMNVSRRIPSK